MRSAIAAVLLLAGCAKHDSDGRHCPVIDPMLLHGIKPVNDAQMCMDIAAARMSNALGSASEIASAAAVECDHEVQAMTADEKDQLRADQLREKLLDIMRKRSAYIVVSARSGNCLANPEFARRVN